MCGFLGEISNNLVDKEYFIKLLNLGKHRGPDQQGYWSDSFCQLGFNRLSIIDLSENAKQPLVSPSGKFALVFNGEIYNYKELQLKYKISENNLRSNSDSEILAHLLEVIDIETFAKELNGMFAISIYDIECQKIYLIRDFAGIKPLFFGLHSNGIIFASQFDQIFCHPSFSEYRKLRPEIMKEYFGLGYMHAPNTVFENIYQVEPGQLLVWDYKTRTITHKTYFFDWKTTTKNPETSPKTLEKFKKKFSEVIQKQLNADVPIATFLSGGIDSPLVTAFSKKHKTDLNAFTFGINNSIYNESDVAQKIAQELNVKQTIENIDEEQVLKIINEHFNYFSEPFGDYSSIPTYLTTQKARKYSTVMLSGDGGDELFWGYPRFLRSVENLFWFSIPMPIRKILVKPYRKIFKKTSSALDVYNRFDEWIFSKQVHLKTTEQLMPGLRHSKELLKTYEYNGGAKKTEALQYLKKNEFYAHLQKVLRKVDLMSMSNSLEVRVPFLDKEIITFSNTIKPEYGITHKKAKYLLRNALSTFVSKKITDLPKKGFSVPIEKWLKNELKNDVLETLQYESFYGKVFINKEVFEQTIADFYNNEKNVNAWGIWHLYAWQKWALNYNTTQK